MEQFLRAKYHTIYQILVANYGCPVWEQQLSPVDELVNTILSQSTTDHNRDLAFAALKRNFKDWAAVMMAPTEAVVVAIRPAGLANQKGPRIQKALRYLMDNTGQLSLDFLAELPLEEAKAWLTNMEGVGPKTAAIILLFAFGRPTFPVDTHVQRVTGRIGLANPKSPPPKIQQQMEKVGDPQTFYPFHLNLIRHGRELCQARRPACSRCFLQPHCHYYQTDHEPSSC